MCYGFSGWISRDGTRIVFSYVDEYLNGSHILSIPNRASYQYIEGDTAIPFEVRWNENWRLVWNTYRGKRPLHLPPQVDQQIVELARKVYKTLPRALFKVSIFTRRMSNWFSVHPRRIGSHNYKLWVWCSCYLLRIKARVIDIWIIKVQDKRLSKFNGYVDFKGELHHV